MLRSSIVTLRPLEREDVERTADWINQTDILTVMGVYGPRSLEEQLRWYDGLVGSRVNRVFAICRTDDGHHIGNASLFDIDHLNANAGLTVFIADPGDRSGGAGTHAVWLLCRYGFDYLNLHRISAKTDNPHASRVYTALGFVHEGTLRQQSFQEGRYVDKDVFGLLRGELREPAASPRPT